MTNEDVERALMCAADEYCSCGGMGPTDPGVCVACLVYHAAIEYLNDAREAK